MIKLPLFCREAPALLLSVPQVSSKPPLSTTTVLELSIRTPVVQLPIVLHVDRTVVVHGKIARQDARDIHRAGAGVRDRARPPVVLQGLDLAATLSALSLLFALSAAVQAKGV